MSYARRAARAAALLVLPAGAIVLLAGCMPGGGFEIGPIAYSAVVQSGVLSPEMLLAGTGTKASVEMPVCDLPTEQTLADEFVSRSDFKLGRFVSLSRLELKDVTVRATSGDFGFATDVALWFVPVGSDGGKGDAVLLGSASAPSGFGETVVLTPSEKVDLLPLLRDEGDRGGSECPRVLLELTHDTMPAGDVPYEVSLDVDAYAELSLF